VNKSSRLRLFTDSNVLIRAIVSAWGLDKAVLSLCASRICKLVLGEAVREEVEHNLLVQVQGLPVETGRDLLNQYDRFIELTEPELVALPSESEVFAGRSLIRHGTDVPVLLSAIRSKPDWLLTHNIEHFSETVARKTGLRIGTPRDFFTDLTRRLK
jgi:predicted nucleic acid-binding protein